MNDSLLRSSCLRRDRLQDMLHDFYQHTDKLSVCNRETVRTRKRHVFDVFTKSRHNRRRTVKGVVTNITLENPPT